jgi:N-hydroxyarylamine O-acetyltransferase
LFAHALETLGRDVTRWLARVRMGDAVSPRPKTHMTLRVGNDLVDVGFGGATPLGPVPLTGEPVTFGVWTYRVVDEDTPEGFTAHALQCNGTTLYHFTEEPRHAVDYVAANHYTSTHPQSGFITGGITAQLPGEDVQTVLRGRELSEFRPGGSVTVAEIDPADLGDLLRDRFNLDLSSQDLVVLERALRA